jgi:hypothetical protein
MLEQRTDTNIPGSSAWSSWPLRLCNLGSFNASTSTGSPRLANNMAQVMARPLQSRDSTSSLARSGFVFPFPTPPGSSSGYIGRPRRHTESESSQHIMTRPRSAQNLLNSSKYQLRDFDDTFMTDNLQDRHRRDDIAALVDFLRNHAPPAQNFMSIPDDEDDEGSRGRWATKLKRVSRRSKSAPRRHQPFQLPDTAVSGTTIGGHRHIAISIPLEAAPLGDAPRSQYPVSPANDYRPDSRPSSSRSLPIRTFTNDKGVVTVLRTVSENDEGSLLPSPASSQYYYTPYSTLPRSPGPSGRRSASPSTSSINSFRAKHQDYFGDSSQIVGPRHSRNSSEQRNSLLIASQTNRMFQRSAYPARASSMVTNRAVRQDTSIDGIIQESGMLGTNSPTKDARRSIADSVASQGEEPIVSEAKSAIHVKSSSIVMNDHAVKSPSKEKLRPEPLAQPMHTGVPFPDSPLLPPNFDSPLTPTSVTRGRSRKEVVRDRKKRDIEAMKNARQKKKGDEQTDGTATAENRQSIQSTQYAPEAASKPARNSQMSETKTSGPTLVPIMVVADLEPCPDSPRAESDKALPASTRFDPQAYSSLTGNPTPPMSSSGSPPQKHDSIDRTSLSRRREWNASREQERQARSASEAAQTRAKKLSTSSMPAEGSNLTDSDKEILRLYEAYRDHRFREMERRLRRLERNGDVWLRALVPVLDNVNRTMTSVNDERESMPPWASDEEALTPGSFERRSRSAVGRPPPQRGDRMSSRRSSLSQGRMLEQLGRKREARESWESAQSYGVSMGSASAGGDDTSGLGTIEPLMRELAGDANRRQKAAERLGVGEDLRRGRRVM